jgi:hypothetical protein
VFLSTTEAISMEASNIPPSKREENEAFWKHHHELLKSSGMKRSDYCRENNLSYDRFGYWISCWNRFKKVKDPIKLVDVRLKPNESSSLTKILCTLDLKNGHSLKIYDPEVLTIILERCY